MGSVTVRTQKSSTSSATRAKAASLDVLSICRRMAIVAGTTNDYLVDFDTLTCTCKAGMAGLHCAHVLRAITERAHLAGYERVVWFDAAAAAIRFCVEEICAGRKPRRQSECGYHYVTTQSSEVVGKLVIDDTVPGRYSVWDQGGHHYGTFATYLAADERRKVVQG